MTNFAYVKIENPCLCSLSGLWVLSLSLLLETSPIRFPFSSLCLYLELFTHDFLYTCELICCCCCFDSPVIIFRLFVLRFTRFFSGHLNANLICHRFGGVASDPPHTSKARDGDLRKRGKSGEQRTAVISDQLFGAR